MSVVARPRPSLEARLARLERSLRRTRLVAAAALVLVAGLALAPLPADDTLRTHRLQLLDARDDVVVDLRPGDWGAELVFFGPGDLRTLRVGNDEHGGMVRVFRRDGTAAVSLDAVELTDDVTAGRVQLHDGEGDVAVLLGTSVAGVTPPARGGDADGGAVVVFRDGAPRLVAPAEARDGR